MDALHRLLNHLYQSLKFLKRCRLIVQISNYFMFDFPEGKEIASVEFDVERSNLHEGSALPTAKLISSNKFMTEFAAGVIRKSGFQPSFKITFK